MTPFRLHPYIPHTVDADGTAKPIAEGILLPADDLFGSSNDLVSELLAEPGASDRLSGSVDGNHAAFVMRPRVVLSVDLRAVRPSHVQCLIVLLQSTIEQSPGPSGGPVQYHIVDTECGLGVWTADHEIAQIVRESWPKIRSAGEIDRAAVLTTPWVYGNKLRLTGFIAPVAVVSLRPGSPVLDLMSGTGIVARALSDRHPMTVNDANPYAALLSKTQGAETSCLDLKAMISALHAPYVENQRRLEEAVGDRLEEESTLIHGEINADAMRRFEVLRRAEVLPITKGSEGVARLATERYANVYFGISQSIEIDSLRSAIEFTFPRGGRERDLCLAALLVACANSTSGPHFAQPASPKSAKALQRLIELRARSIAWEFELALGRLLTRRAPRYPFLSATCGDWRQAIATFADAHSNEGAGVYVDPPYSKLQYSRYYHVLNVLLAYDYPTVSGNGRYPPLAQRFSSRFEYQPGMAQRELSELIQTCAKRGLTMLLSYAEGGFVGIDHLMSEMGRAFESVTAFSEPLRHHSQGRALVSERKVVLEHLLVGTPS